MASNNAECAPSRKKDVKRGLTRMQKTHKAKSNGVKDEVMFSYFKSC